MLITALICSSILFSSLAAIEASPKSERARETIQLHYLAHTSLEIGGFGSTKEAYDTWVTNILAEVIG